MRGIQYQYSKGREQSIKVTEKNQGEGEVQRPAYVIRPDLGKGSAVVK